MRGTTKQRLGQHFFKLNTGIATLALAGLSPNIALAIPCAYDGGNGNWSDTTSWDTNGLCVTGGPAFPNNGGGNLFDVTLGANGTVTLTENINIRDLNHSSNTVINSDQTLTVEGTATISAGSSQGASGANTGRTIIQDTANINGSHSLNTGYTLENQSQVNWNNGTINLNPSATSGAGTIQNNSGATFSANGNNSITASNTTNGNGTFNNNGTFEKVGGTGTTSISVDVNNTGNIDVQSGNLFLSGTNRTFNNSGSLNTAAGSTITLNTTTTNFNTGATTTGSGTLNLAGSTLNLNVDHAINSAFTMTSSNSRVAGTGVLTLNEASTFSAGTLRNSEVNNQNVLTISGSYTQDQGNVLNNANTINWNNGTINLNPSAVDAGSGTINNLAGANFNANGNNSLTSSVSGEPGTFNNMGTFTKAGGTGTTTFATNVNNTGTIDAQSGNIFISGTNRTFNNSGNLNTAAGSTITLNTTTTNFNTGATTTGSGTLNLAGSTLNVNVDHAINSAFTMTSSNSRVAGTGVLTLNEASTFSAGTLRNSEVNNQNVLTISGSYTQDQGNVLNNANTINWNNGTINLNPSAVDAGSGTINNLAGANFNANGNNSLTSSVSGEPGTFNNMGTFTKAGGTGTTTFATNVNNTGTIDAQSGNIFISGTNRTFNNSGNLNTAAGSTIILNTTTTNFNTGATTTGSGTLNLAGSTLNVNADHNVASNFSMTSSSSRIQSDNTLTVTGDTQINAGAMRGTGATVTQGALNIGGSFTLDAGHTLRNEGTGTWTNGTINLNPSNSAGDANAQGTLHNAAGATLTAAGNNSMTRSTVVGGEGVFQNDGTFSKNGGLGTTSIVVDVNNTGTMQAQTGTLSLQGDVDNLGTLRANGGNISFGSASTVNNSGTVEALAGNNVTFQAASVTSNNQAGDLTGGTWRADGAGSTLSINGASVTTNSAEIILSGAGSVMQTRNGGSGNFTSLEGSLTSNSDDGTLRVLNNRDFTSGNGINNAGTIELGGGTFSATSLTNGGEIFGNGALSNTIPNSGTIRANGGNLNVAGTTGTTGSLVIDAGASMDLGSNSTTGTLSHNGTALNLGANNVTVSSDYNNANFGSGNSFDARANVNGAGQILAAGNTAQTITGDVANGSAPTVTLNLGNVRVGDSTSATYQVANTGTSGPSLRTAIQTSANGGNVTDPGFSGSGVTAGNLAPIATGANSGDLVVNYNASTAGAVSGQVIHIENNFDNVGDQNIEIQGFNVFRSAAFAALDDIDFGNVLVGNSVTRNIVINNTALGDGFSEDLNAAIASLNSTGVGVLGHNNGSVNSLFAGSTDSTSLQVTVTADQAGAITGTVSVAFETAGTVQGASNGLGTLSLGSDVLNFSGSISGNAGNLAVASAATPNPVNGTIRVGDSFNQALSISNLATGPAEGLNAAFDASSTGITAVGSFNNLGAGATDSTSLVVGLADTSSAGNVSGTATIGLDSDGTFNSGTTTALADQTVNLDVDIFNAAAGNVAAVDLGDYHVGQGQVTGNLVANNTAAAGAFTENLRVDLNNTTGADLGATVNGNLVAGGANGTVGAVTSSGNTVGNLNGTVSVALVSDGTGTSGLAELALGDATASVTGTGYRLATPDVSQTSAPAFVRVGDAATSAVTLGNTAIADGFSENLNGQISGTTGGVVASGSVAGLVAGASSNNIGLALDTSTVGVSSGTATLALTSDGDGINSLGQTALASQVLNASTTVTQLANPLVQSTYNFGNVRVGDSVAEAISVQNQGAAAFTDVLLAQFDQSTVGNGIASLSSNSLSLAGGASNNSDLIITIDTAQAGTIATNAGVLLQSDGSAFGFGVTNLPDAQVAVSGVVQLVGNVFNLAEATVNNAPINLGAVRVGDASNMAAVSITNTAPLVMSESLNAAVGGTSGGIAAAGSFNLLAAGQTDNSSINVGLASTATAGTFNGNATLDFVSDGTGTSGLGQMGLPSQDVAVTGQVFAAAVAQVQPTSIDFGTVRVGDVANAAIQVSNAATGALTDVLRDSGRTVAAGFTVNGALGDVAAGDSANLTASLDTAIAGTYSGSAGLSFISHNDLMADLALQTQDVLLTGTVNNLAEALFESVGGAGSLSRNGDNFLLDFGRVAINSLGATLDAELGVRNAVAGPADNLNGIFSALTGSSIFDLTGFDAFAGLLAGDLRNGLLVSINTIGLGIGVFEAQLTLDAISAFAGLSDITLNPLTLAFRFEVTDIPNSVPEPSNLALLLLGLVLVAIRRQHLTHRRHRAAS